MKKIILFIITMIFLLSGSVLAELTTKIDIKESFNLGDTISFTYTISSDTTFQIIYTDYVECPNAPITFLEQKTIDLKANEPYTDTYSSLTVDESIEPQTCTAYVQILSPVQMMEQKNFSIITNPSFSFNINFCKDQACKEKSKTFIQNTDIYLDYDSEVPEPSIIAILIFPDQTTQQLTIPTSIKATQIGTYELEITASKQDYKTITKKEQFGIIEKQAEIPFVGVCNANGKCEAGENYQNCPQDCKPGEIPKKPINIRIILAVLILIFILIIIYFKIIKKRKT